MVKLKSLVTGVAAAGLIAAAPVAGVLAKSDNGNDNPHNKITICHATPPATAANGYVVNSPNANGNVDGHVNHAADIIPPFDYNDHGTTKHFPGQNWTASGQAIYNNGCKATTPGGGGGGQGGGGGTTPTSSGGQVQGTSTQSQSQVSQVPVGSANGGGGGISDFSLTSLARDW